MSVLEHSQNWKPLLCRRLRAVAHELGCRRVEVRNVRMMATRPVKMYAEVMTDGAHHIFTGKCENDIALKLHRAITAEPVRQERVIFDLKN